MYVCLYIYIYMYVSLSQGHKIPKDFSLQKARRQKHSVSIYILRATPPAAGPLRAVSTDLGGPRDGFKMVWGWGLMGGYLGLGDLGSDIQDPNCSEARYSIHSLSLGLRDQIQVTFVVSEALRGKILDTFVDSGGSEAISSIKI